MHLRCMIEIKRLCSTYICICICLRLYKTITKWHSLSSCITWNSCDITARWKNYPFCFKITFKHAIYWNSHVQHFQNIKYGKSIAEMQTYCLGWMRNVAQKITRGSRSIIARFAWKCQTIWECVNIACRRFQTNITCNSSINTSRWNKEACSFVHWSHHYCLIMLPIYLYMYYVCTISMIRICEMDI